MCDYVLDGQSVVFDEVVCELQIIRRHYDRHLDSLEGLKDRSGQHAWDHSIESFLADHWIL